MMQKILFLLFSDTFAKDVASERWYKDTLEEIKQVKAAQESLKDWQGRSSRNR